jgi:hypothetical protein
MLKRSSLTFAAAMAAVLPFGLTSCDTPVGQGAGIGAASGAIIGGLATNRVGGAAAGAAAGALAGGLIGAIVEQNQAPNYGPPPPGGYPRGTPTQRPGYVISPYAPYYEIDTQGAPHGALVRDPSCNRLFIQP